MQLARAAQRARPRPRPRARGRSRPSARSRAPSCAAGRASTRRAAPGRARGACTRTRRRRSAARAPRAAAPPPRSGAPEPSSRPMSAIAPSTPTRRPARRGSGRGRSASTSSASAHSSIVRAIGPAWSKTGTSGKQPSIGTSPWLGLKPAVPHAKDGMRIEPPVSVPMLSAASPADSAAALPPEEPPAMWPGPPRVADRPVERVLARHAPRELVQVGLADDHGAGVDDALDGGRGARRHVVAEERRAVGRAHARRCRTGPWARTARRRALPAGPARASERASSSARSRSLVMNALSSPRASMRSRWWATTSSAETSPARTRCAIS